MSESTWRSRVSNDCGRVTFLSPEGRFEARVIGGSLRAEPLWAVQSLSMPVMLRRILRGGRVVAKGKMDVELAGPLQRVTLRFKGSVPASLVRDLTDLYEHRRSAGVLNAEFSEKGRELGKKSGEARRAKRTRWMVDEGSDRPTSGQED